MDNHPTQDPGGLAPADDIALRRWGVDHPGVRLPPDVPPETYTRLTRIWLWRTPPDLPGDWRNYLALLWSYPAPDAIANTPEWSEMRWTAEATSRNGGPSVRE